MGNLCIGFIGLRNVLACCYIAPHKRVCYGVLTVVMINHGVAMCFVEGKSVVHQRNGWHVTCNYSIGKVCTYSTALSRGLVVYP